MFFGEDKGLEPIKIPMNMNVAMAGGAFLCTLYGIAPNLLYNILPYPVDYHPYGLYHIIDTVQLLTAALIVFWIFLPKLKTQNTISLDTDWLYRKPFKVMVYGLVNIVCHIREFSAAKLLMALKSTLPFFANPVKWAVQTAAGPREQYDEDRYRFPIGVTVMMSIVVFLVTFSYIVFI